MTSGHYRKYAWIASAVLTAIMFCCIAAFLDFRFDVNDDAAIQRAFMGYESKEINSFQPFIHDLFSIPLAALGTRFPGIPWFSLLQLSLLILADVIIGKSIIQCVSRLIPGILLAAVFFGVIALPVCTRITFTQTAGLLVAAAVLQILSSQPEKENGKRLFIQFIPALVCVISAYALRQIIAVPALAFCSIVFAYKYMSSGKKKSLHYTIPFAVCMLTVISLLGGLTLWRTHTLNSPEVRDYMEWQEARPELVDYYSVAALPDEALEKAGVSKILAELTDGFFFLDPVMDTETVRTLLTSARAGDISVTEKSWKTVLKFLKNERQFCITHGVLIVILFGTLLFALLAKKEKKRWALAALLLLTLLAMAMLLYLAAKGRLPLRAARTVLLPYMAGLFGLYADIGRRSGFQKLFASVMIALSILFSAGQMRTLRPDEFSFYTESAVHALDTYALSEPDVLLVYDISLACDYRLFPETEYGIPDNITFWGGWSMRSAGSIRQFEKYGIDQRTFDGTAFLDGRAYFVSWIDDSPPVELMLWLREKLGTEVDYEVYSEFEGLYVYRFYESDDPSWTWMIEA